MADVRRSIIHHQNARFASERGDPRCQEITYKGTQCTRIGGLRRIPWLNNEWRCYQHG